MKHTKPPLSYGRIKICTPHWTYLQTNHLKTNCNINITTYIKQWLSLNIVDPINVAVQNLYYGTYQNDVLTYRSITRNHWYIKEQFKCTNFIKLKICTLNVHSIDQKRRVIDTKPAHHARTFCSTKCNISYIRMAILYSKNIIFYKGLLPNRPIRHPCHLNLLPLADTTIRSPIGAGQIWVYVNST